MQQIPHSLNISIGSVRSWTTTSFIIFHLLMTLYETVCAAQNTSHLHSFSPISLREHCTSVICIPSYFNKILWKFIALTKRSAILAMRHRDTATTSIQLGLMSWKRNWRKFKHAQTCLAYDEVARLQTKSSLELHSQTMHFFCTKGGEGRGHDVYIRA
jgi:hypothetical protein